MIIVVELINIISVISAFVVPESGVTVAEFGVGVAFPEPGVAVRLVSESGVAVAMIICIPEYDSINP